MAVVAIVLALAMVVLSVRGAFTLPPEARFRFRVGTSGIDGMVSKTTGLIVWPAIGAFVALGGYMAESSSEKGESLGAIAPLLVLFLLLMQIVSIRRAT